MTDMTNEERTAAVAALGLTIDSVFVPFSQSRNTGEKSPTLNWTVTVKKNGRPILITDYSAGCAHCPAYKAKGLGAPNSIMRDEAIRSECETGRADLQGFGPRRGKAIEPDSLGVLSSLAMDSDVIDSGTFEDWAGNFGYDTDSRKAETIYRACLETALKLRSALGDSGLQALRNAFEGY